LCLAEALTYQLGTFRNMGPGLFPAAIGGCLIVLGLGILLWDARRSTPEPEPEATEVAWRAVVMLPAAVLVFAAVLRPLGLAPATFLAVFAGAFADSKIRTVQGLAVALAVTVVSVLVFREGLGVQVRTFEW